MAIGRAGAEVPRVLPATVVTGGVPVDTVAVFMAAFVAAMTGLAASVVGGVAATVGVVGMASLTAAVVSCGFAVAAVSLLTRDAGMPSAKLVGSWLLRVLTAWSGGSP